MQIIKKLNSNPEQKFPISIVEKKHRRDVVRTSKDPNHMDHPRINSVLSFAVTMTKKYYKAVAWASYVEP